MLVHSVNVAPSSIVVRLLPPNSDLLTSFFSVKRLHSFALFFAYKSVSSLLATHTKSSPRYIHSRFSPTACRSLSPVESILTNFPRRKTFIPHAYAKRAGQHRKPKAPKSMTHRSLFTRSARRPIAFQAAQAQDLLWRAFKLRKHLRSLWCLNTRADQKLRTH